MVAITDPSFGSEWALGTGTWSMNVQPVWAKGYTGKGVRVAVIDNGVQYTHPDIAPNYDAAHSYDYRDNVADAGPKSSSDSHGTVVAGTIAAAVNGTDAVGVAYDATILSYQIGYGSAGSPAQYANAINAAALNADVANNSWSYSTPFQDNFFSYSFAGAKAAIEAAANQGRNGLGTIMVFSAGNNAGAGDDTNYHSFQNAPSIISVAATDSSGALWNGSTRGESILIAAPGSNIVTSDLMGSAGYGSGNTATVSGTSLAAPELTGVVALMLDANPGLGWRDVQEILALTARQNSPNQATWRWNGATDWNGGARHFSTNYGFGLVDAAAAVRVAESWTQTQVSSNQAHSSITVSTALQIPDNGTVKSTVSNASHIAVEKAVVDLNLAHADIGDLIITLTSPKGTVATLFNRPGVTSSNPNGVTSPPILSFEVSANTFWGESADGNWTLTVTDANGNNVKGALNSWTLRLDGDAQSATRTFYYTDEFGTLGSQATRATLSSASPVVMNAAALSGGATIDLAHNSAIIAGRALSIAAGTTVTQLFTGDGNDTITASDNGVWIDAGRGANVVAGGKGADTFMVRGSGDVIDGGAGTDTAVFTGKFADYTIQSVGTGVLVTGNGVSATLAHVEKLQFTDTVYDVPQPTTVPVAIADTVATVQAKSVTFAPLDNDTPTPGAVMHVSATGTAAHGTVVKNVDDTLTYRPAQDYVGSDSFTYTISDGKGGSSTATVTVQVGAVTPVANNDAAATKNATPVTFAPLANDSDPAGNTLKIASIVNGPTHGTLKVNADQTVTYTPDGTWSGADGFSYVVDNGHGGTATGSAIVTVGAPTSPPPPPPPPPVGGGGPALTLIADTVWGMKDAALPIYPTLNDGAGITLQSIATGPAHGQLVLGPNDVVVYLPDAGYVGSDSFTYAAKNASGATGTATVSITIGSTLPGGTLKGNGSGQTVTGSTGDDLLTGSGADILSGGNGNDSYFVSTSKTAIVEAASGGIDTIFSTVSYNAPTNVENVITYYNGIVSSVGNDQDNVLALRYGGTLSGGNGNDLLIAGSWNSTLDGGAGDDVFFARGTVAIEGGDGSDTVVFAGKFADYAIATSGTGLRVTGNATTATLSHVEKLQFSDRLYDPANPGGAPTSPPPPPPPPPPPAAPTAQADSVSTVQAQDVTFAPLANDTSNNGALHVTATTAPAHGTVITNADDTLTYKPGAGFVGNDSFTYTVTDAGGGTSTATVAIQVGAVTPVASNDTVATRNATPVTFAPLANDSDPAGNALAIGAIVTGPAHGTLVVNQDQTVTYTPDAAWSGADAFTYLVDNGHGGTASAVATINVAAPVAPPPPPPPPPPVATLTVQADSVWGIKDAALPIYPTLNDGTNVHLDSVATGPAHGQLVLGPNDVVVYLPDAGYVGSDSFTYTAKDASGATGTATVSITIGSTLPASAAKGNGSGAIVSGTTGDDILTGSGTDVLVGGAGNDAYYVSTSKTTVSEAGGGGIDTIFSTVSYNAADGVENVITYYNGIVSANGNDQDNVLALRYGGTLSGGAGNDLLISGTWTSTLTGGAGADRFVIRPTAVNSRITDFTAGEDSLDLHLLGLGNDPIGSGVLKALANGSSTDIWYDADGAAGAGAAVKLVTLANFAPSGLSGTWWA